jgi:hypothetical protein
MATTVTYVLRLVNRSFDCEMVDGGRNPPQIPLSEHGVKDEGTL